jgi:CheY-like chemotaxis protein
LGLATVHGIVNQSGGHIDVYTELGLGTSFKIYLPAVSVGSPEERVSVPADAPVVVGVGTILVCEDDDHVRRYISAVLTSGGYTVLSFGDFEAAIAAVRGDDPIDVVITDVVMPGMGGPTLADHLQQLRPGLPVIFVSGYPEERLTQRGLPIGATFLQKPFGAGKLISAVQTVMASNVGPRKPMMR